MANSRTKRVSMASGPNYGPGRLDINPHQRKISVVCSRVPDLPKTKKKLNWDSPKEKSAVNCSDKVAIISTIVLGLFVLLIGTILTIVSFVVWRNGVLEIVGPCLIGVGGVMCVLGGFALGKKVRGHIQQQDDKEGEDGEGYVNPDVQNVSLAEIREEAAPDESELYTGSGNDQNRMKRNQINNVMKDFDSDTIPGLIPLPTIPGVPSGDFQAPLVAYPNIPRDQGDIKMASATYKVPMTTD